MKRHDGWTAFLLVLALLILAWAVADLSVRVVVLEQFVERLRVLQG